MLYQLIDGCCCCTVMAESTPEKVASAFGKSSFVEPEDSIANVKVVVTTMGISGWSIIFITYDPENDYLEGDIDSDPLIRQARKAVEGEIPEAPLNCVSPVTVAAHVSAKLNCRTIGVWGSDQGEGIGGGALCENGKITQCLSAAGPDILDKIIEVRKAEDDGDDIDDLLDEIEEACIDSYWQFKNGKVSQISGDVCDAFDKFLSSLKLDSEDCLEYYDCMLEDTAMEDEVTWVVEKIDC